MTAVDLNDGGVSMEVRQRPVVSGWSGHPNRHHHHQHHHHCHHHHHDHHHQHLRTTLQWSISARVRWPGNFSSYFTNPSCHASLQIQYAKYNLPSNMSSNMWEDVRPTPCTSQYIVYLLHICPRLYQVEYRTYLIIYIVDEECARFWMTSISILSIRLSTHISKILDDKAVVESVHLGEVEFWHRRIHNGTCVPLLVKAGEIYSELGQIYFELGQIHFKAWTNTF